MHLGSDDPFESHSHDTSWYHHQHHIIFLIRDYGLSFYVINKLLHVRPNEPLLFKSKVYGHHNNTTQIHKINLKRNRITRYLYSLHLTKNWVRIARGGCVDIWHSYKPSSVLFASAIRKRQLFGCSNSTLNLLSNV